MSKKELLPKILGEIKQKNVIVGKEILVKTKEGNTLYGVLMGIHPKHLATTSAMGIISIIPLHLIIEVSRVV